MDISIDILGAQIKGILPKKTKALSNADQIEIIAVWKIHFHSLLESGVDGYLYRYP